MKILVLLALVSFALADDDLQCFKCDNCGEKVGDAFKCGRTEDVCMKVKNGDHILRKCGEKDLCGLGKVERAANRAWTEIANVFKDVDEDATLVYCCDDDFCNAGFQNLPSFSIIALPLILVALLKY